MQAEEIKQLIEAGLPGSWAEVDGDGRHWNAVVVSESFAGKSMLAQHRQVYGALGDSFDTEAVHALSLRTFTPEQWKADGGGA
ncbi:MAG: BolA/IbaG family iron-sulfur metabolism protein [Gammaproteobacteria bacterium]|nr:BolA/IbaG family iron-sulfur metabolism protein [Gammaproteobacteria bacterium]